MAEENTMDRGGKIWEFLSSQVLYEDGLYAFDQMNNDEKWTWWEANKDKFADKPGFSSVINESKTKDWKTELAKYDDKLLTDEVLEELAEDNNLNVEDLKRYREDNKRAKEYSEGRARREKEIKDAGVFSPWTLASDYSKQRYIDNPDNPDNSIFGKEGKFNPYSTEGQEELSDLAFGAFGAAGDGDYTVRYYRYIGHGNMEDDDNESSWFNYKTELVKNSITSSGSGSSSNTVDTIAELKAIVPTEGMDAVGLNMLIDLTQKLSSK